MSKLHLIPGLVIVLVACSCSSSINGVIFSSKVKKSGVTKEIMKSKDFVLDYGNSNSDDIEIRYLGSGGVYLANSKDAILIDPFFSHARFLSLPFKRIRTSPADVDKGLGDIETDVEDKVGAILVAHSHYDHLMDVPYIYENYINRTLAGFKIYGNNSMVKVLGQLPINSARYESLENDLSTANRTGAWISVGNGSIRFLPIKADHAPHFKAVIPLSFYKGEVTRIKGLDSSTSKTKASQWKGGQTLSFLVDFMEHDKTVFRVFVQSSAAAPKNGFVEEALLQQKPVDLAILGGASFANVDDYLQGLIEHLKPEKIIVCHWEDFFRNYGTNPKFCTFHQLPGSLSPL